MIENYRFRTNLFIYFRLKSHSPPSCTVCSSRSLTDIFEGSKFFLRTHPPKKQQQKTHTSEASARRSRTDVTEDTEGFIHNFVLEEQHQSSRKKGNECQLSCSH